MGFISTTNSTKTIKTITSDYMKFTNASISGSNVTFTYDSSYSLVVNARNLRNSEFGVIAQTLNERYNTNTSFGDAIKIEEINLDFSDKIFFYPDDVKLGSLKDEIKFFEITEINTNQETVNILGTFRHYFKYTSSESGATDAYGMYGIWCLYLPSFTDILESIKTNSLLNANQSFIIIDTNFIDSASNYMFGSGSIKLSVKQEKGVMVGVSNLNYSWKASNETCGNDFGEYINLDVNIGKEPQRWGTPLWSKAFVGSASFLKNMEFNSRIENNNGKTGTILHEITNIALNSSSIMGIANRRIKITGNSKTQEHTFTALNGVSLKANVSILNANFEESGTINQFYDQDVNFNVVNSAPLSGYVLESIASAVSGSLIKSNSLSCCSSAAYFPSDNFIFKSVDKKENNLSTYNYDFYDTCVWKFDSAVLNDISASRDYTINLNVYESELVYTCPETFVQTFIDGTVTPPTSANISSDILSNDFYLSSNVVVISAGEIPYAEIKYRYYDPSFIKVTNINIENVGPCDIVSNTLTAASSGFRDITTYLSGSVSLSGVECCSGSFSFPSGFTLIETVNNLSNISSPLNISKWKPNTACDSIIISVSGEPFYGADLVVKLVAGLAGTLAVDISSQEDFCQSTIEDVYTINFTANPSGNVYTEYATNFIQEYRADSRNKVPENWITTNDNGVYNPQNGIVKPSQWKRFNDGVGLGGDAPDYDTIYDYKNKRNYTITEWKEIGEWYIGQMAVGTPRKAVVFGGHAISRDVAKTLKGSGLHSSPTTKRVFIWDQADISPEDTYLKNYNGRRFNTYYTDAYNKMTSNENKSSLNVIVFEGESDIIVERHGNIAFDGTTNAVEVVFDKPLPQEMDVNYSISMTCDDNIKVWWENKTTNGFTVKCEVSTWKGNVDYLVSGIIKVTEKDIADKGDTNGYIFDK